MAKLYGEIASSALMTFDKSFVRMAGQPLDSTEVYYSLEAAKEYAKKATAYIGQKIVVVETVTGEDDSTSYKITHYSIEDTNGTLKELGAAVVSDNDTISVDSNGVISLANIKEEQRTGEWTAVLSNGKLTWSKVDNTTIEGVEQTLGAHGNRLDALEGKEADFLKDTTYDISAGEKVLSLNDTKFSTEISLVYDSAHQKIQLLGKSTGEDNQKYLLSEIDASVFVEDGILEDVTYDDQNDKLVFTWNTTVVDPETGSSAKKKVEVPLGDLVDTYTASSDNKEVSAGGTVDVTASTVVGDSGKVHKISAALKEKSVKDKHIAEDAAIAQSKINGLTDALNARPTKTQADGYYAPKGEFETTKQNVGTNTSNISGLDTRITNLENVGSEKNVIVGLKLKRSETSTTDLIVDGTDRKVDLYKKLNFSDLNDDSGFDSRITKNATDIGTTNTNLGNLQNTVDGINTTVGENKTAIGGLQGNITGIENILNDTTDDQGNPKTGLIKQVTLNTSSISSINGSINSINGEISTIKSDLNTKAEKETVEGIGTRVGTLEGTIKNKVDSSVVTELSGTVTTISGTVDTISGNLTTLSKNVGDGKKTFKETGFTETNTVDSAIAGIIGTVDTLLGSDKATGTETQKTIRTIANEEIAAALLPGGSEGTDDKRLDSLQEIAAWIQSHPNDAAAMNKDITALLGSNPTKDDQGAYTGLGTGSLVQSAIDASIAGLINTRIATTTNVGFVKANEGVNGVKVDAEGKMEVASLSVDKLQNKEGFTLILNGGKANSSATA